MDITFTVIITSHNRPILLERALRSLLIQDSHDFEVIVAMDVWCQQSIDIVNCLDFQRKKLVVIPGAKGPSETRNEAKRHAKGRFVIFLDDDDQLLPTFLQDLLNVELSDQSIHWTNYVVLQELINGTKLENLGWKEMIIEKNNIEEVEISNFIPNSALVYPRHLLLQIEFDTQLSSLEDWDFIIQAKRKFTLKALSIFGPVISMPQNQFTRNSQSQQAQDHFMDIIHIYRKWRTDDPLTRQSRMTKINGRHLRMTADHF